MYSLQNADGRCGFQFLFGLLHCPVRPLSALSRRDFDRILPLADERKGTQAPLGKEKVFVVFVLELTIKLKPDSFAVPIHLDVEHVLTTNPTC
jgi:hypothetical protein